MKDERKKTNWRKIRYKWLSTRNQCHCKQQCGRRKTRSRFHRVLLVCAIHHRWSSLRTGYCGWWSITATSERAPLALPAMENARFCLSLIKKNLHTLFYCAASIDCIHLGRQLINLTGFLYLSRLLHAQKNGSIKNIVKAALWVLCHAKMRCQLHLLRVDNCQFSNQLSY